jgi:hypothetical protein
MENSMNDADFVSRLIILPIVFVIDPLAPIVVLAWALRLGWVSDPYFLQPAFAGLATDGFLAFVTVAYIAHALADKVAILAHLMDLIGILLKPVALAFVGLWLAGRFDPASTQHWASLATILVGGVPAAFALQTLRTKFRLGASVGSLGVAHTAISTSETLAGMGLAYLTVLHPVAAAALVLAVGLPVIWLVSVAVRAAGKALSCGIGRLCSRG